MKKKAGKPRFWVGTIGWNTKCKRCREREAWITVDSKYAPTGLRFCLGCIMLLLHTLETPVRDIEGYEIDPCELPRIVRF